MKLVNQKLKEMTATFESRLIKAIVSKNDTLITKLMLEAEFLYKEEYLTDTGYNCFTDVELMKEIYG